MKAITYIQAMNRIINKRDEMEDVVCHYASVWELIYNQKFNINLIANPKGLTMPTGGFDTDIDKVAEQQSWREAQDLLLFEGLEFKVVQDFPKNPNFNYRVVCISREFDSKFGHTFKIGEHKDGSYQDEWTINYKRWYTPKTIDDFINQCRIAEIELTFKEKVVKDYFNIIEK